ncbi:MAG: DPP IV N-terminal domain-containing protein [Candidatus Zixiibacteriota bacterium]
MLCSQSCSDKPNDDVDNREEKPDTTVHWLQLEIDCLPSWSPDGSKIIYMREKAESARDTSWVFGAFIHDVNQSEDTCIWPNVRFDGFSWAPDSRKIAVVQAGQIYIYDFATDSLRRITFSDLNFSVSWSPCGDKIVYFARTGSRGMKIYDFVSDSTFAVPGQDQSRSGDWMPNCSTLVLMDSCREAVCGLYGYNLYSDSLWLISRGPGFKMWVSASPDGNSVAYSADYNLWHVNLADGNLVQLTMEGGDCPEWSPDSQWIVYTRVDRRNGYLWLMRPDGSENHQITF